MNTPDKNAPENTPPVKNAKNTGNALGINRGIYAAGNSAKDGLIWGAVITGALIAVIGFGKENSKTIRKMAEWVEKGHGQTKAFSKSFAGKIKDAIGIKKVPFNITPAETAAAVGLGYIGSHAVMVPSAKIGWDKSQQAIDKYNALSQERDSLVIANAELIKQNQGYRAQVAKKDDSFAQRASEAPAADVSGSRSV